MITSRPTVVSRFALACVASIYMCVACADIETNNSNSSAGASANANASNSAVDTQPTKKSMFSEYRSVGKIAAPIDFVKPARFSANAGEIVRVELNVRASSDLAGLSIQANTEPGLLLEPQQSSKQYGKIDAGQIVPLQFEVLAVTEGTSYVNVICEVYSAKGKRMTSYAIPVDVGNVLTKGATDSELNESATNNSATKIIKDDSGVTLRVMDARPLDD